MNEEIIKICIYYLEKIGVQFIGNSGKGSNTKYKDEDYIWYYDSPFKLYHRSEYRYKDLDFFKDISKLSTFKNAYKEKCRYDLQEVLEIDDKELYDINVNTPVLDRHKKDVENFLLNYDIFKIQSPMATRKTNIIFEIIEQANAKNQKILMISNRRPLAQESFSKYKHLGFKYYEKGDYTPNDHLVVQFDSLWKYNLDIFDIVIIDEITSLLLYITEPYQGKELKYRYNVEQFLNLNRDKKIVLLDSFIIYNPFEERGVKEISLWNSFREDLIVKEYISKYTFWSKIIYKTTKAKETISISSSKKNVLQKIYNKLSAKGVKCLLLTGDTKDKDKIFSDLQKITSLKDYGYDVILYSPVVTTGVSFFFKINDHFHFDSSGTIDPVNSIQMIRRIRNAKTIHYFIQGKISYKPTDIKKIKMYSHSLELFKMLNSRGVELGFTDAGEKLAEIIRIKNIFTNTHKYAFKELMKYQFKEVLIDHFEMDPFKI
jgi:hypothetical protein